jgi:hypothetical protein
MLGHVQVASARAQSTLKTWTNGEVGLMQKTFLLKYYISKFELQYSKVFSDGSLIPTDHSCCTSQAKGIINVGFSNQTIYPN